MSAPPDPAVREPPTRPDYLVFDLGPCVLNRCNVVSTDPYVPHHPDVPYVGDKARFSPFTVTDAGESRQIPTLYASSTDDGAICETVFHDIPVGGSGPKRVTMARIGRYEMCQIEVSRNLALADFTSDGLHRIDLPRTEIIESGPLRYSQTVRWAQSVHDDPRKLAGIVWVSRLQDRSLSMVFFGDRINRGDLVALPPRAPLGTTAMLDRVTRLANRRSVLILGLPLA